MMSDHDRVGRNRSAPQQLENIMKPHDNDVLSGRGNFVNYHPGNERFRALVKEHKVAYVSACKSQKPVFARQIVGEIRSLNPPGRFLKQDSDTRLWHDIGDKKAIDKTRQALREGAPELEKQFGVIPPQVDDDYVDSKKSQSESQGMEANLSLLSPSAAPSVAPLSHTEASTRVPSTIPSRSTTATPLPHATLSVLQPGRVNPSLAKMDPLLKTHLEMEALKAQLNAMYPLHNLPSTAPTTTQVSAPSLKGQSYMDGAQNPAPCTTPRQAGNTQPRMIELERSDSLDLKHVFQEDVDDDEDDEAAPADDKMTPLPWRKPTTATGNSRSMGMSFSIGDMTDTTDLSEVFEDSLRISDMDEANRTAPTANKKAATTSLSNLDVSIMSLTDVPEHNHSAMNISYSRVFDESDAGLQGVDARSHQGM